MLMGATLPAMSRWVETSPQGVAWLGYFYGGNTGGAVIGSLLAGFYLLRVHDMAIATYVAVALNLAVGALALLVAGATPYEAARRRRATRSSRRPASWAVYVAIALSGMTALASQVIWTRTLSLLFGATVYTFSLILAVFLFGIGIGSSVGSVMARGLERPRLALGWVQMLLCGAIAWAAYTLALSLPFWPIDPSICDEPLVQLSARSRARLLGRAAGVDSLGRELPARAGVGRRQGAGSRPAGRRRLRRQHRRRDRRRHRRQPADGHVARHAALAAGAHHPLRPGGAARARAAAVEYRSERARARRGPARFRLSLGAVVAALLARNVPPIPKLLVAYGRYAATRANQNIDVIYMGEGWNASVAVTRLPGGVLNYHNAGKVQASSEPQDMRLQRMLGHLTTLIPKSPKKVLVIGCGAGVTAGAVSIDPYLEHETIAEIEPLVPKVVSTYFAEHNFNVVTNPKVHVQLDDARHYLMTTNEKFDAITSDPLDPVGQGRGDALHAGVLRDRQVAPESRRRRHAVRAALREQHRGGEERDRDVHGSVSERRRSGATRRTAVATTSS